MGKYWIWSDDLGQDEGCARAVSANSTESAVTEWAERQDARSADYTIVGGQEVIATVRDCDTGEVSQWIVTGESVPLYRAREVTPNANSTPY